MREYLETLNKKQFDACIDTEGPSLIIAGAGSGKTKVLTSRIAHMIENCGVSPENILAITFTNKAAKEMNDRLFNLVGSCAKFVTCKTFHSFCAYILRNEIEVLNGRKRTFQIIDDDETEALIKQAMVKLNFDVKITKPKTIAGDISLIKSKIKSIDYLNPIVKDKVKAIMDEYNSLLLKNNLLDFDDLMLLTTEIFNNYPNILNKYQDRFRYILVDEFQDTSNIQYEFIELLGSKYENVFIVGDEDQSIYSFRGANIRNIRRFMDDFPNYHKHILDQNYRSTKPILDCANKLISHNIERIKKDLWTEKDSSNSVVSLFKFDSDKAESRAIVNEIKRGIMSGKYNYSDYAIIYRNNFLSRNFENDLIANQIPYRVYSGTSFYKRKEVRDMLGYLRLMIDPNDFYSFKRVINTPKRGIGDTTLNKIEIEIDKDKEITLREAVRRANLYETVKTTLNGFFDKVDETRKEIDNKPLKEFFLLVYKNLEYKKFIDDIEDDDERDNRSSNIEELLSAISEVQTEGSTLDTLTDFLQNVSLLTDQDLESKDSNHVTLITMHSAKGLEYKNVFAVGIEDDSIPGLRAIESMEIEEERRIFYVCLTRAMENLFISCATSRYKFGSMTISYPSRFLKELDLIVKTERDNQNKTFESKTTKINKNVPVGDFKPGDKVKHTIYKSGTVLGQVEGFYIIKFDSSPTPKKVIVGHPFLEKE